MESNLLRILRTGLSFVYLKINDRDLVLKNNPNIFLENGRKSQTILIRITSLPFEI
jgi:hypothetical protein